MAVRVREERVKTLCSGCSWGTVVELDNGRVVVNCSQLQSIVERPVVRCTEFTMKGTLNIRELKEQAWILRKDPKTKEIGFKPPGEKGRYVECEFTSEPD